MKLNNRRYGYLFIVIPVFLIGVFLIVYFLFAVGLTGKAPELYRFIDKIKSANISSPLLYLATSESKDENIEQLRQVAEKYSHRDSAFSERTDPYVKKVEIAGSLRTALFAPAPSRFTFSVRIPEKPFLSFGYALIPDAWEIENSATTFKIWRAEGLRSDGTAVKDGKEHLLFSDSIDPRNDETARRWFDGELDLSSYEGERVELVFETAPSDEEGTAITYGYAVWSNPTLYAVPAVSSPGETFRVLRRPSASGARKPSKPNVLLISIDTLRADHLSCYGYHRRTSPNIDKLAQEGVLFKNTFSQCSWTIPSHGSIFSSKLPHRHGGTIDTTEGGTWHPLPFSNLTLAEVLRENGYITAAFTSGGYMITRNGLHQGFDLYYNNSGPGWDPVLNIERLVSRTSNWLKRNRHEPFFLFFHTFEVHTPYVRKYFTEGLERGRLSDTVEHYRDLKYLKEATDAEKEYTIALYDGGIYHADRYIGMLLETLSQLGLSHNTIIVLTSDHGEEFWEHYPQRAANHGHSGYDELLHVPLIFMSPYTNIKGRIIEDQVRSVDIFPTILSALSIKYEKPLRLSTSFRDKKGIDGKNLLPMIQGESKKEEHVVYSEDLHCGPERKAIRTKRYKYIYAPDVTQVKEKHTGVDFYKKGISLLTPICQEELYDLEKDPNETMNIALIQPELAEKFRKQVREVFGIPTSAPISGRVDLLNSPSRAIAREGRLHIRLEGITKRVETVIVQGMNGTTWSLSDGSLSMYNNDGVIDLRFDSPGSEGGQTYKLHVTYDDNTVERMSVTFKNSEFIGGRPATTGTAEGTSIPKKEADEEPLKQLKQLGYMYIDPGTTGIIFSSLAYLLAIFAALFSILILPFRRLFRYLNNRFGQERKIWMFLLSGAVVLAVMGFAATCVLLLLL